MKRKLLLTVDYEIFGNGTGDVRRHVVVPAGRMAEACERHGMPLTVFFEVEEFVAFRREKRILRRHCGYDPAEEIHRQAVELAGRGHDLQLHLHPEWVGSGFERGRWRLNRSRATVDSLFASDEETADYLRERKAVVDELRAAAGLSRPATCYRAGAFCAQPGRKLLRGLAANGIVVDSSLVRGLVRSDDRAQLDFRAAPEGRRHWRVSEDVAVEDPSGPVVEVPIHSRMARRIHQFTPRRLLAKFSRSVPDERRREMVDQLGIGRSPADVLRFLGRPVPIKLDFHNMSPSRMLRWIREAPAPPPGDMDVIVLIGHTKEHRDHRGFEAFLSGVAADPDLEVISMDALAQALSRRLELAALRPAGDAPAA